jgi:hypothetical protein
MSLVSQEGICFVKIAVSYIAKGEPEVPHGDVESGAVPGSRLLPAYRPAILQSGSPPGSCWATTLSPFTLPPYPVHLSERMGIEKIRLDPAELGSIIDLDPHVEI